MILKLEVYGWSIRGWRLGLVNTMLEIEKPTGKEDDQLVKRRFSG